MLTELRSVDNALATSPAGSDERARLLRSAADLHSELAELTPGKDEYGVPESNRVRREAIRLYGVLQSDYPGDPAWDEAVYFGALESERLGDVRIAAATYMQLLRAVPTSSFAALAYYGLGETFAVAFPNRLQTASRHFEKLVKSFPTHPLVPFALLRLGELAEKQHDRPAAAAYFERLEREFPGTEAAARLATARTKGASGASREEVRCAE